MNKEKFIELINDQLKWNEEVDKIDDMFHGFIIDTFWGSYSSKLFDILLDTYFKQEAIDDINWWLYEKNGNPELKMWNDNIEVPMETVEDLWNWVKNDLK